MKLFNCEFEDIYKKLQTKRVYAKNYNDAIKYLNEKYRVYNLISVNELDENLRTNDSEETKCYKNLAHDNVHSDENKIISYIKNIIEKCLVFIVETLTCNKRVYKVFNGHSNPPKPPKQK